MRLFDYDYEWRPSVQAPNSDEEKVIVIHLYGCIMPILSIWELELKINDTRYQYKVNFCTWSPVFEWGSYQFEEEGHNFEVVYNAWTPTSMSVFDLFVDGKEYHSKVPKGEYYSQYYTRILIITGLVAFSCILIFILALALSWDVSVSAVFGTIGFLFAYFAIKAAIGCAKFCSSREGGGLLDNEEIPI